MTNTKLRALVLLFVLILLNSLQGQTSCDSVTVEDIRYASFNDSLLLVEITNTSSNIFSYPGFVLLSQSGDTIGMEQVNFFGIGGSSIHTLRRNMAVSLPNQGPMQGTLHLWTGFYQNFVCSWPVTFTPCPPPPCSTVYVTIGNSGGALVSDTIDWQLLNSTSQIVGSGSFELDGAQQADQDSLCLPSGSYTLSLESPLVTGGQLYYGVSDDLLFGSSVQAFYNQAAPANDLVFHHYTSCTLVNNIEGPKEGPGFLLIPDGSGVHVRLNDHDHAGVLSVTNTAGELVMKRMLVLDETYVSLAKFGSNVLYFTVEQAGTRSTIKYALVK